MKHRNLLKTMLLLSALIAGSSSVWAQATVGTTLWAEDWTGGSANETPSAYGFEGTTVYGGGTLTYAQSSASTKLYEESLAGGTSPELLLSKSNQTWTISNIPTGLATAMTLSFKSNKTTFNVTSPTTGITISGSGTSWTLSQSTDISNFVIVIKNTGSNNARVDDISLTVKTAGAGVTSLSIKNAPTKVRYEVGETLDMTGFVLDADGKDVSSGYTMTMGGAAIANGATLSSAGKNTITVAYGGKEVTQNISVGAVQSIAVTTPPTKTSYDTGDSFDPTGMVVTATLSTGEPSDPDTWTKDVTGYTFSPDGALVAENTSVTITYATKTTTQAITVTDVAVTGVSLNKASTTIEKTKTETLTLTFTPSNATNKNVTWESDDTSVATVDAGVVTGVAAGTANITVTTEDGSKTATCVVTVVNQKGTAETPYSVAEVISGEASGKTGVYVLGYIVGNYNSKAPIKSGGSLVDSNFALADEAGETDGGKTIPVELSSGSGLRTSWGPLSNADNIDVVKVVIKGNGQTYFSTNGIKGTSSVTKVAEAVKVTSAGYATYASDSKLDFTGKEIKAYIAERNGTTGVTFTQVNKIPANTGVLLYKDGGVTEEIPVYDGAADDVTGNVFVKGEGVAVTSVDGSYRNYILNQPSEKPIGFYKAAGQTVAKNRAYIHIDGSAAIKEFIALPGMEDDATSIEETLSNSPLKGENIFNLAGQRIQKLQKGINIVNGKKIMVK